ncbi:MAG TPA: tRNA pseudouridine(54/55) synthase Pus10 [Candidatus Bilamarchaeum sp.]|nr:tRNA pseudouridine(54/55) synthase Pus10 [Candidatus Bilamarchaeum sp.]
MLLCKTCNAANGNAFAEGQCYICGGGALKVHEMMAEASRLLSGASSFSISTVLPRDWLAREEKAWDARLGGAESIKNHLNRTISAGLGKAMEYDKEGEVRAVFDFETGKVSLARNELFIFGRYRKIAAGLSQSRWVCSACDGKGCAKCQNKGKFYESVEERVGEPLKKAFSAEGYVLHASGREDVDATNSAGRPFVMELKAAAGRRADLDEAAKEIAGSGEVSVSDLKIVPRTFVEMVTESHFDKAYEAEVEFGREITDDDAIRVRSLEGKTILQETPTRVAHRRADLVRHRKLKHVEVVNVRGNRASLLVKAEAGTYIKELISGDRGRTNPSIAGELKTGAVCTKLNVSMIDDGYLDFVLART